MATRNIVKLGDDILRKTSRTVLNFDDKLAGIIDDMVATLYEADGVGLAAPQVGILKRICVVDTGDEGGLIELVNPVIIEQEGIQHESEGCLSIPDRFSITERPMKVKVRAQNRYGETFTVEGTDLKARAFCHEIDHLNGILFIDRLYKES